MERTVHLEMDPTGWVEVLGTFWCRHFHTAVMWPIHGEYECRSCGRRHSVPWDLRIKVQERPGLEAGDIVATRKAPAQESSPKHRAVLGILAAE